MWRTLLRVSLEFPSCLPGHVPDTLAVLPRLCAPLSVPPGPGLVPHRRGSRGTCGSAPLPAVRWPVTFRSGVRRGARSWTQTSELPFRPPVSLRDIAVEVPPVGPWPAAPLSLRSGAQRFLTRLSLPEDSVVPPALSAFACSRFSCLYPLHVLAVLPREAEFRGSEGGPCPPAHRV